MSIKPPDALVGAVALEYILLKLKPQLEDDADFSELSRTLRLFRGTVGRFHRRQRRCRAHPHQMLP